MPNCPSQGVVVTVNGEEIPTVNDGVESRFSTDGPAKINRISEINFPLSWDNEDIQGKIDAFDANSQSGYDTASVFWQHARGGEYVSRHYGYVRGVGGAGGSGVGKFFIDDPSSMVTAIPFSKKYDEPNVGTVLQDVLDEFNANTPFNAAIGSADIQKLDAIDTSTGLAGAVGNFLEGDIVEGFQTALQTNKSQAKTSKTFKANEHTLKDALDWITNVGGGDW